MTVKLEKIRLLLVDDNPDDRMLVLRELRREFGNVEAKEVTDEVSFNTAIEEGNFDVVITDFRLSWSDGIEILKKVKMNHPGCPVIMFTATGSEEIAVKAMKEGVDDYIPKSQKNFIKLPVAVLSAIEKSRAKIEHEKAVRELRESEERYRSLFETSPEAIMVIGIDGRIIDCNHATAAMSGLNDRNKLIGKKISEIEFIEEESLRRLNELFLKFVRGEVTGIFETQVNFKDGIRWIEVHPSFLRRDGEIYAVQAVIRDITERKLIEEALKRREEEYRTVVDNANESILVIQDGLIKFANSKTYEVSGYSKDDIILKPFIEFIHPDDRQLAMENYKKRLRGEKIPYTYSLRVFGRGGEIIWVDVNAVLIEWEGRPATLNFLTDITDRMKSMKKLEESERKYRTTFEQTGTAMVIIEEDTTLSLVNSEFEKLSGYSKEEIEGKMSWTQFVHPEDLERMRGYHYARRRGEDVPKRYEFRFVDREGNVRNIFLTIDVIPGTKKSVGSLIDITQMRRLNNLLKAISEINELVAREKNPKIVLKTVCDKLTLVYDAVFTSLRVHEDLVPVESKGISLESIKNAIRRCPSITSATKGVTGKMRMDDETCRHCTKTPHRYVLSTPLIRNGTTHGVITIHSSTDFNEDEITLLERLSRNIAFAISAYKVEEDKRKAFEQLATNLMQFEHSADRLRNPLAAIMSSLELRDEIGYERLIEIIDESAKRIKKELDKMRKEEIKTFKLMEDIK